MPANREKTGQFKSGHSGNPNGRPKMPEDIREAYRALVPEAVETIADVMRHGRRDFDRLEAAETILDRAYGKPVQMQDISMDMAGSVDLTGQIRRVAMELVNDKTVRVSNDWRLYNELCKRKIHRR